jgi:hypothetical protein
LFWDDTTSVTLQKETGKRYFLDMASFDQTAEERLQIIQQVEEQVEAERITFFMNHKS